MQEEQSKEKINYKTKDLLRKGENKRFFETFYGFGFYKDHLNRCLKWKQNIKDKKYSEYFLF